VSGATEQTLATPTYRLTLMTPRISFAVNPVTGESGEAAFHAEAAARFAAMLAAVEAPLTAEIDRLLGGVLVPYDEALPVLRDWNRAELAARGGPLSVEILISSWKDLASLRLCTARLPDEAELSAWKEALEAFFAR
jgi:hypothetical protein